MQSNWQWAWRHGWQWIVLGVLLLCLFVPTDVGANTCADFDTQPAAQRYFDERGGGRTNNVDSLDEDHDGIPCEHLPGGVAANDETSFLQRAWLPVTGTAVVLAGGAGAVLLLRNRRSSPPINSDTFVVPRTAPVVMPVAEPWPETTPERRATFEAMGDDGPATYLASQEWLDKEAWKTSSSGGACELCGTSALLTLYPRTLDRRYREQPTDVLILCSSCASTAVGTA